MTQEKITMLQAMDYEIRSSRFASSVSWKWLQNIIGAYYGRKVLRKHRRYSRSIDIHNTLIALGKIKTYQPESSETYAYNQSDTTYKKPENLTEL